MLSSAPEACSAATGRLARASMAGRSLPLLLVLTKREVIPRSGLGPPDRMDAADSSRKLWCSLYCE